MQTSKRKIYDAIVVGSGATGGWAAKALTERGMTVLVLEAGRQLDPQNDFREHTFPYELKYRGLVSGDKYAPRQPIQSRCYAANEYGHHLFVDDIDNPYTTPEDKPFWWIRGRHVGGRSITWGRQSYRLSDYDFKAAERDGYGDPWPFSYKDLEPYYDQVENFVGISGSYENLPQLPDSKFLPPMAMTCGERILKKSVESKFPGRNVIIGRAAILTRNHQGRAACHYCGHCDRGCSTHSYYSSPGSTLPAAAKTGRMTLRPNAVVREIIVDPNTGKAGGVRVVNQITKQDYEEYGKVIVLCASTLESTRILLNSKSRQHPDGLGNSSGVLGRYLMDHMYSISAGGVVPVLKGMEYDYSDGRANGIYVPRFRNIRDKHPNFIRGYGMQGNCSQGYSFGHAKQTPGFGSEFKKLARENPGEVPFWLGAWCEMLPRKENGAMIDPEKVDAWGIPVLRIECAHGDNERAMAKDALETIKEMVDAAGFRTLYTSSTPAPPGFCIHEVGTARMGVDPKSSVLNKWNQSWDVKNVFVTDGACFVSQGCQNPTLTMMAITARACDYIANEFKGGNI
ncbi:MAG TPA: GMC family oxidoreductase [Blastocatellia bacterium]|nr:GMC family oxidoreductase [Blastocatellia bacterium]